MGERLLVDSGGEGEVGPCLDVSRQSYEMHSPHCSENHPILPFTNPLDWTA